MHDIKIGTLVDADRFRKTLKKLAGYGFETFSITFWQTLGEWNLESMAKEIKETLIRKRLHHIQYFHFYQSPCRQ